MKQVAPQVTASTPGFTHSLRKHNDPEMHAGSLLHLATFSQSAPPSSFALFSAHFRQPSSAKGLPEPELAEPELAEPVLDAPLEFDDAIPLVEALAVTLALIPFAAPPSPPVPAPEAASGPVGSNDPTDEPPPVP